MATATLTSKGQITIPTRVRAALGLGTGDRIEFVALGDGKFAIMATTHSARVLKGLIRKPAKAVSIEDMNQSMHQRS